MGRHGSNRLPLGVLACACLSSVANAAGILVSPARVVVADSGSGDVTVVNQGTAKATVTAAFLDYRQAPDGKVTLGPAAAGSRSALRWLTVSPASVTLAGGAARHLTVTAAPGPSAPPGDSHAALMITSKPQVSGGGVPVSTAIGIGILTRVTSAERRDLKFQAIKVTRSRARRLISLGLTNAGNLDEELPRGRVRVQIRKGGRTVATLRTTSRHLLPGVSGQIQLVYTGKVHGPVDIVARIGLVPTPGVPTPKPIERTVHTTL